MTMKHSTELKIKDFLARELHGKSYNALNEQEVTDVSEVVSHLEGVTDEAAIISEPDYQELVAKAVYEKSYQRIRWLNEIGSRCNHSRNHVDSVGRL